MNTTTNNTAWTAPIGTFYTVPEPTSNLKPNTNERFNYLREQYPDKYYNLALDGYECSAVYSDFLDSSFTANEFFAWLDTKDRWFKFFGTEIIEQALQGKTARFFLTKEEVRASSAVNISRCSGLYCLIAGTHTMKLKECKGEWSREVETSGMYYITRNHYDLNLNEFYNESLRIKFPYLAEFKYSAYGFNGGDTLGEIYVSVPQKSVYVPLEAMAVGDYEIVKNRQISYFTSYYKWPGGWGESVTKEQVMAWQKENIDLLNSPEALRFKKCMEDFILGKYIPKKFDLQKAEKKPKKEEYAEVPRYVVVEQTNKKAKLAFFVNYTDARQYKADKPLTRTLFDLSKSAVNRKEVK